MKHDRRSKPKTRTTGAKRKTASSRGLETGGKTGAATRGKQAARTKKGPATRRRGRRRENSDEMALAMRRAAGRKRAPTLEEVADVHSHTTEPGER